MPLKSLALIVACVAILAFTLAAIVPSSQVANPGDHQSGLTVDGGAALDYEFGCSLNYQAGANPGTVTALAAGDLIVVGVGSLSSGWASGQNWNFTDSESDSWTVLGYYPWAAEQGFALYETTYTGSGTVANLVTVSIDRCIWSVVFAAGASLGNWAIGWVDSSNYTGGSASATVNVANPSSDDVSMLSVGSSAPTLSPTWTAPSYSPIQSAGAFGLRYLSMTDSASASLSSTETGTAGGGTFSQITMLDVTASGPGPLTCVPYQFAHYPYSSQPYSSVGPIPVWENATGGAPPLTYSWSVVLNGSSDSTVAAFAWMNSTGTSNETNLTVNGTGNLTLKVTVTDSDSNTCVEWEGSYLDGLETLTNPIPVTPPPTLVFALSGKGVYPTYSNRSYGGNVTIVPNLLSVPLPPSDTCGDVISPDSYFAAVGWTFEGHNYSVNYSACPAAFYVPMNDSPTLDLAAGVYHVSAWVNESLWLGYFTPNVTFEWTFTIENASHGGGPQPGPFGPAGFEWYWAILLAALIILGAGLLAWYDNATGRRRYRMED